MDKELLAAVTEGLVKLIVWFGLLFVLAYSTYSCTAAHGATYGNDTAATSVVVATATAAGADSTKGGR